MGPLLFWLSCVALVLTLLGAAGGKVPWWVPCFVLAFIECVSRYGAAGK